MKLPFILSVFLLFAFQTAQGQPAIAQPASNAVFTFPNQGSSTPAQTDRDLDRRASSEIVTDTILLPLSRRSTQRGIIMNTTGSITGASQYYSAPQPITITGFEFFAYKNDNSNPNPAPMKCEIYEAGNNFLPTGSPLFSTIVNVPYSSSSVLAQIRQTVILPNPITVNTGYVITIELTNVESVVIASNNWETQDGDGDFYAGGKFSSGWTNSSFMSVGNPPVSFDADFFMQPYVKYTLKAGLKVNKNCLTGNDTIVFNNTSSPIFTSKIYNKLVFLDSTLASTFRWTFGDGSPPYYGYLPPKHGYPTPQKYTITKRDSLLQWSFGDRNRLVIETSLDKEPIADFIFTGYRNITFTNQSEGIDKVKWIFSDGTYSNLVDPVYYFFGEGPHDVTLIIENGCGSDTITKTVEIAPIGIQENLTMDLTIYPNPASDQLLLSGKDLQQFESIELMDLAGRVVFSQTLGGTNGVTLPVADLARGWYLLRGNGTESSFSRPVVLK